MRMKYIEGVASCLGGHCERNPRVRAGVGERTNSEPLTTEGLERGNTGAGGIEKVMILRVHAEEGLDQLAIVGFVAPVAAADAVNVDSDSHVVVMGANINQEIRRRAGVIPLLQ